MWILIDLLIALNVFNNLQYYVIFLSFKVYQTIRWNSWILSIREYVQWETESKQNKQKNPVQWITVRNHINLTICHRRRQPNWKSSQIAMVWLLFRLMARFVVDHQNTHRLNQMRWTYLNLWVSVDLDR